MLPAPAAPPSKSSLQRAVAPLVAANPGRDGVYPLANGRRAYAARMLLVEHAERTLDLQYYIWHGDRTGTLLFEAVRRAAERGVRVRLLLDDTNTAGLEALLATLDAHPNVEVRLFNPLRPPRWRWLGLLTDFRRLNRRMHGKSFTVDGAVTIIGGRNVGDEYFDADDELAFRDLDVLAVGDGVAAVSALFERFWNSRHALPLAQLLGSREGATRVDLRRRAGAIANEAAAAGYRRSIETSPLLQDLLAGALPFEWTRVTLVADEPDALDRAPRQVALLTRLQAVLGAPERELHIVSSYFVPTGAGVLALAQLARSGVRIRVLTNALEATDVVAVHAGYARYRRALLRAGISLFEMRGRPAAPSSSMRRSFAQSRASLHAKTFAVDGRRAYVGSFNLDPRSAALNTELGFVIESAVLARSIARSFETDVPAAAYEVGLAEDGRSLRWTERSATGPVTHAREPGASLARRVAARVLSWLPLEWML